MLDCQKSAFDLGDEVTYLNCAYLGPLSKRVQAAGREGLALKGQPWHVSTAHFFEPCARLRATFARLISARQADDVAILPSVSYGLANAAANIPALPGKKRVVMLHEQFPSNYYCWARLARQRQWELVQVAPPRGAASVTQAWNEALLDAIDERTAVVAMSPAHWATGTAFDLKAVSEKVHRHGAIWVLDATQYLGAHPFDVETLAPDAVVAAGYKFLLGPYGMALGWYGERFHEGMPIEENWANRKNSDDFARLVDYQPEYRPRAQRFNVGEQSNFIAIPMMQAALEQVLEWGPERIQDYCRRLVAPWLDRLRAIGIGVEPAVWHLFGLRLPKGVDPEQLKERLAGQRISVSVRGASVRVAPHVYNTAQDMEHLVEVLQASLRATAPARD